MGKHSPKAADPAHHPIEPTSAQLRDMIAVAAYYVAERRGFAPGGEQSDWLQAERQITRVLAQARAAGLDTEALHRLGLRNALQLWGD